MSYKYLTNRDSPNYTKGRPAKPTSITIHWWGDPKQNPSFEGVVNWLCGKRSGVSAHYVATGTGRQVACIVDPDDTAWHADNWNGNQTSIGIECDPRKRTEDYDVVAELIANLWKTYGKLPLKRHSQWSSTQCPGGYSLTKLKSLAEKKLTPPKPTPKPVTVNKRQSFAARTFVVTENTTLVKIPSDTRHSGYVYKKGRHIEDVVELLTASNGKTFYRTKYARDTAKKMYGFKGNVLKEYVPPVPTPTPTPPPVEPKPIPPVAELPNYPKENNVLLKKILDVLFKKILELLTNIFKGSK
jgi:hypothetical protein